jgi:branched-chain amino acid transport system substrate-binding protein
MKKATAFSIFVVFSFVFLTLSLYQSFASDDEVRLGVISPASGNYADAGAAERRGITMAVEEINEQGGVLGKKVRMIVEDTETDPAVGARKAKKLIERDQVHFMIGEVSSAVAIAVSEVAQRANIIYFNSNTNSDECTGKHAHRTNFRVGPSNHMVVFAIGPWAIENIGKKWYFMTHDYTWGRSGTEANRLILQKYGGTELGEALVPLGTRDFSSYLIKIRNLPQKPDMIMCTVGGVDVSAMLEQVHEFGMAKDYNFGFTLRDYTDVFAVGAEKNIGMFACEWYHKLDVPGVKEFVERYKKRFPDCPVTVPENSCYNGYIGTRELLRAAQRAGTLETTPIVKALEGYTFSDNMKYDPTYIREWDHQFIQDVFIARAKTPEQLKEDPTDFYEIVGYRKGQDICRTREENPVELEPYQ